LEDLHLKFKKEKQKTLLIILIVENMFCNNNERSAKLIIVRNNDIGIFIILYLKYEFKWHQVVVVIDGTVKDRASQMSYIFYL